jgi:hypothetical protein
LTKIYDDSTKVWAGTNASYDNSKNAELKGKGRTSGKGCLKRTSDGYINTTT